MPEENILGRKREKEILKEIWNSKEAEFLAIYGRRRVGKTQVIREYFSEKGTYFEITGQKDGSLKEQLENFIKSLSKTFYEEIPLRAPNNWKEAFELLTTQIEKHKKSKKIVIFLDELPWLATKRSGLLSVLDYFWSSNWSRLKNLILIVCGSAASWMLEHLILENAVENDL